MRVAVATDEDTPTSAAVVRWLREGGHEVEVVVRDAEWPEVGRAVGGAVAEGRAEAGVVLCWTGTGVSIAANKVSGVRAALCGDAATAHGARKWNDANVLALSLRSTTPALAAEMLEAFFSTDADPAEGEAVERVEPA